MAKETSSPSFNNMVERYLDGEPRELWIPVADEFERNGPDGAKVYLDIEGQRLEERIKNLISEISD